jgi:uncharacterized protein (DUF1778 family)
MLTHSDPGDHTRLGYTARMSARMSHLPERPRRRTRTIALRVSDRELDTMHAGARAAGITLAELVRGSATREARQFLRDQRASDQAAS